MYNKAKHSDSFSVAALSTLQSCSCWRRYVKGNNDELYQKTWYEKWTLGRMIQFNTSSPMKIYELKLDDLIKTMGCRDEFT